MIQYTDSGCYWFSRPFSSHKIFGISLLVFDVLTMNSTKHNFILLACLLRVQWFLFNQFVRFICIVNKIYLYIYVYCSAGINNPFIFFFFFFSSSNPLLIGILTCKRWISHFCEFRREKEREKNEQFQQQWKIKRFSCEVVWMCECVCVCV